MVDAGDTVMLAVVAPPGDHEYVPPAADGVAVSVAFCPTHIVGEFTLTVGGVHAVAVQVAVDELKQLPPVGVTVIVTLSPAANPVTW